VSVYLSSDSVRLPFLLFSDGAAIDFAGYMAANRTIIGDLSFSDAAGVVHLIGGGCDGYRACLDPPGGQLDFIRGGTPVVATARQSERETRYLPPEPNGEQVARGTVGVQFGK
jgi:hypothetical protein